MLIPLQSYTYDKKNMELYDAVFASLATPSLFTRLSLRDHSSSEFKILAVVSRQSLLAIIIYCIIYLRLYIQESLGCIVAINNA